MPFVVPPRYLFVHVALGFLAYTWAPLIPVYLAYQLLQYALGVRFFFLSAECWRSLYNCGLPGNSFAHTLNKIAQFSAGWLASLLMARASAGGNGA
jgi:hypothetical protein